MHLYVWNVDICEANPFDVVVQGSENYIRSTVPSKPATQYSRSNPLSKPKNHPAKEIRIYEPPVPHSLSSYANAPNSLPYICCCQFLCIASRTSYSRRVSITQLSGWWWRLEYLSHRRKFMYWQKQVRRIQQHRIRSCPATPIARSRCGGFRPIKIYLQCAACAHIFIAVYCQPTLLMLSALHYTPSLCSTLNYKIFRNTFVFIHAIHTQLAAAYTIKQSENNIYSSGMSKGDQGTLIARWKRIFFLQIFHT